MGHAAAQKFDECFDRVAKAAHARLAVADVRGRGDSGEDAFCVHGFGLGVREREASGA